MKIGKNIKAIRVSQKMEQKELANRLHISNKTISSWECDRTEPNIGMFEKIAEALNVTKTELLEGRRKTPDTITVGKVKVTKGNKKENMILVQDVSVMTNEERELLAMFRIGKYKEIANLMMDKMTEGS